MRKANEIITEIKEAIYRHKEVTAAPVQNILVHILDYNTLRDANTWSTKGRSKEKFPRLLGLPLLVTAYKVPPSVVFNHE